MDRCIQAEVACCGHRNSYTEYTYMCTQFLWLARVKGALKNGHAKSGMISARRPSRPVKSIYKMLSVANLRNEATRNSCRIQRHQKRIGTFF